MTLGVRWRADLGLVFVALIWGSTFVLVKSALDDVSANLFLTLRFSLAAIVLAGVWLVRPKAKAPGGWLGGIATGTALYAGYVLQTLGLLYTTPARSGFITGLYIVGVPILSAVVYKKAPLAIEWIGIVLAACGLILLTLNTTTLTIGLGELLTIGCAIAFAIHMVVLGHNAKRANSDLLALLQIGTCALLGLSTFWWLEVPRINWSPTVIFALAVTGFLATALAFWIQTWAQKHTTATRAALIFSLEPVFAWVTAYFVSGETLHFQAFVGAALILAGILLVELKPGKTSSRAES